MYFRYLDITFANFTEESHCQSSLRQLINYLHCCPTFDFKKDVDGKLLFPYVLVEKVDQKIFRPQLKIDFLIWEPTIYTLGFYWLTKTEDDLIRTLVRGALFISSKPWMWKRLFRQPLPLPLTKIENTTAENFFNFCESVTCLLLHFIILRRTLIHVLLLLHLLRLSLLFQTTLCLFVCS